jgi:hypothetical protein
MLIEGWARVKAWRAFRAQAVHSLAEDLQLPVRLNPRWRFAVEFGNTDKIYSGCNIAITKGPGGSYSRFGDLHPACCDATRLERIVQSSKWTLLSRWKWDSAFASPPSSPPGRPFARILIWLVGRRTDLAGSTGTGETRLIGVGAPAEPSP